MMSYVTKNAYYSTPKLFVLSFPSAHDIRANPSFSSAVSRVGLRTLMIFLTGANGHLGANLLRRLIKDGHSVRVFLRANSDNTTVNGLPVERVYGDLRDLPSTEAGVRGCDRVYHCAAKVSTLATGQQEIWECNVIGTRNLLLAARNAGVTKVVVSGSFSAVGHEPDR